jgi:hypothetical protein
MQTARWQAIFVAILLAAPAAHAQTFERTCLPQEDAGDGLSLGVDARNRIHVSRISRLTGALLHTLVRADGQANDAQVVGGVSLLAVNEVDDTQIVLNGLQPRICYHHAVDRTFEVARQTAEGWQREVVHEGVGAGRWCTLRQHRRTLVSVFGSDDGRLRWALRRGDDNWDVAQIDDADEPVGRGVSLTEINGALVAAHRTEMDQLRVTWQLAEGWQSESIGGLGQDAGRSITALAGPDGGVRIVHGATSPPNTSDAGLLLTSGRLGMFETRLIAPDEVGGSSGVTLVGDAITVITRLFRRSPIFGNADGLRYYGNAGVVDFFDVIEAYGSAEQRHRYRNLDMTTDRFGLPVFIALVEASRFNDERGTAFTCLWRPRDGDADGIPDDAEGRYGTDIDNPDSDGDGRLDGDEVLLHGTDPLIVDPIPPDMGMPDLGVADFGLPDLDAGEIDAGEMDVGVEVDARMDAAPTADATAQPDTALDMAMTSDGAVDAAALIDAALDAAPMAPDARMPGTSPDAMPMVDMLPDRAGMGDEPPEPPGGSGGGDGCGVVPGRSGTALGLLGLLALGIRRRR